MSFGITASSGDVGLPIPRLAFAFDEGSGYEFSPTIGTAIGTVAPAYAAWEQGVHGSALGRWMGGDNFLMAEASTNLNSSTWNQLTVMAWVMPINFGGEQAPLLCESSSQEVFGLVFSASSGGSGAVRAYVMDTMLDWSANNTVQPGAEEFVHIACTWDGSIIRLYVNGEEVSSGARTTMYREQSGSVYDELYPSYAPSNIILRVEKSGDTYTGRVSSNNGSTWTTIHSVTQTLSSPRFGIYVGASDHGSPHAVAKIKRVSFE